MHSDVRRPRQITGKMVLAAFVAFFVLVAAANAFLLRAATSTFGGVEVASAYRVGLSFNKEIEAAAQQDARGWTVDAKFTRRADDTARITVRLRDAAGAAPGGLSVVARLMHPADARRDRQIDLREIAGGEFAGDTDADPGRWDLLIEAMRAGETVFKSRSRVMLK